MQTERYLPGPCRSWQWPGYCEYDREAEQYRHCPDLNPSGWHAMSPVRLAGLLERGEWVRDIPWPELVVEEGL